MSKLGWSSQDPNLIGLVNDYHAKCVEVYKRDPNRLEEDAGKESGIAEGGYGRKQIQELVQNAADALRGAPGRVQVTLNRDALYVANQGESFVDSGVRALLYTHLSNKTGGEIGRFGLGFKSISGISDGPQIFSQSVSFEFSRSETAHELSLELGENLGSVDVPALRLAWVLDPNKEFRADPILSDLAGWAVTIIKVPLKPDVAKQLSEEISDFDESFNLFAPHVKQLDLHDTIRGEVRRIAASKSGNKVLLSTEDGEREWLVFSAEHQPSSSALESAGRATRRDSITVSWAVPSTGKVGVGQLCAFFPVKSDVTLSGRINAPWKLSDDRINVIECEFNYEILTDVVPQLVVEARRDLIADGAYGRYIDILPARGREERSWADGVLNEPVYSKLRESRCLPDLDGQLRSPNSLRRIPSETIGDWADEWREVAGLRETWIHPDCTTSTERRSKVDRLMAGNSRPVARVLDWLEAVVAEPTPVNSAAAIEIAAGVAAIGGNTQMDVKDSRIVLLETEQLQRPVQGQCFIRTAATQGGSIFVDSRVTSRPSTLQALEDLGITAFEDGGEMLQLLSDLAAKGTADWDALWIAMRGSGQTAVRDGFDQILRGKASQIVRVRNGKGEWVLPESLYLAGERLKQLKEDGTLLVDGSYHAVDSEILSLLGVRGRPTRDSSREPEKWFRSYMKILISTVGDNMSLGIQAREKLQLESSSLLRPLECLPAFGSTNKAALTVAIIDSMEDPRVRVTHPSQERAARFIAPEMWWVKEHGILPTVLGPVPVREAFDPSAETEELAGLLPVVTGVEVSEEMARVLGLRTEISDLDIGGFDRIVRAHVDRDDLAQVGRTYSWWCATHPESAPDMLLVRTQGTWAEVAPSEVAVALSVDAHRGLDQFGIPCVLVETPEDSYNLREFWGCLEGKNLPLTYAYETSAEPVCLVDAYDIFDELDLDDDPEELTLQKCLSISKVAAVPGRPEMRIDCAYAREGNSILVTASGDREILKQVLACLELDDSNEQVDSFLSAIRRKRDSKRMREIRNASDDAERLLAFAGEERLKTLIPRDALKYLENSSAVPPRGAELARLCITMLGVRALERVCKVDPHGLAKTPPSSWQGSYLTRNWVRELGFSDDWAGQKGRKRNKPTEYVDGPTQLKPLHDYQDAVSKRLRDMLIGTGPRRGIISLPTGAGKTRVAVQTIIEAIESGDLDRDGEPFLGPILWLADGEELCEQAIDAWSFLWRAKGRQDTQLVLSRYWSNYEIEEELGGVQVVIATWQKISRSAVSNTDFAWLSDSPIVVIDEAHGALHPSYTGILAWAGRSDPSGDKALLGLTATPFRGRRDSDESKRLLRRFADNILDADVFGGESAQLRLQRDEVLARARLEILHGVDVDLSTEELEEFRVKFWMPRNAETRLGRNEERTQIIFDSIMGKPDAWPIVVFATSVENAQTLATLLTLAGRPAASIDKDTSPEDRRTAIDRFKSGELRVLTNYAVLSQGFDAPMTRAVYITRPTTSEVRYQQMIGRGLRGPRNGGSDEVLIVNVLDNVVEFADSITFDSLKEIIQEDGGS